MIVDNERRQPPARYGNPFRSNGKPHTACARCPEYRLDGRGEKLARFGLRGACGRDGGMCAEVRG